MEEGRSVVEVGTGEMSRAEEQVQEVELSAGESGAAPLYFCTCDRKKACEN